MINKDDRILAFDTFEGDFGDPGDKVFQNKMCIARKPGPCSHCNAEILQGEKIRRQTSKFDGSMMTHRWCSLCCDTMARYEDDLANDNLEMPEYERRAGLY